MGGKPNDTDFGWGGTRDYQTYPGNLLVYRYWRIMSSTGLISSVAQIAHRWSSGYNSAVCWSVNTSPTTVHPAPDAHCKCGFYGWYRPEDATRHLGNGAIGLGSAGIFGLFLQGYTLVFGAAHVTGLIVPGDYGVRAARAKPVALVLESHLTKHLPVPTFKTTYPDVEIFSTKKDLVKKYPPVKVPWLKKQTTNRLIAHFPSPPDDDLLEKLINLVHSTDGKLGRRFVMSTQTKLALEFLLRCRGDLAGWSLSRVPIVLEEATEGIRLETFE